MTNPELPGAGAHPSLPDAPQQATLNQSSYTTHAQPEQKKQSNILGLIALIAAIIGFIFVCIPGALIVGWVLLPVAFVLALVSLFLKGKAKWTGVTALILAIVGTIVGFIVFFVVVATSFDEAFSGGDVTVVEPAEGGSADEAVSEQEPAVAAGTRENPHPIGTTIESDDWRVVINSVALAATDTVVAEGSFNTAPEEGLEYILVNYSATYIGSDSNGQMPAFVSVEYVTPDGQTVDSLENFAVAPDAIDTTSTLYTDATATGNTAIAVPSATAGQGVLAVRPGMLGDKVFFAVQ